MMDSEMQSLENEFRELQSLFKEDHQNLSILKTKIPKSKEYSKKIKQLESERDQLKIKINSFQQRIDTKDIVKVNQMKDLVEAARILRKEQEEEMTLNEKFHEQKQNVEIAERKLLTDKQRLLDTENLYGQSTSAYDMLQSNRKKYESLKKDIEDSNFEFNEKIKIYTANEEKLSESIPNKDGILKKEAYLTQLIALVKEKELKCRNQTDTKKEEKLSIFRQQVGLINKKKTELIEEEIKINKERISKEVNITEITKKLV